jgi:hypothetical protein
MERVIRREKEAANRTAKEKELDPKGSAHVVKDDPGRGLSQKAQRKAKAAEEAKAKEKAAAAKVIADASGGQTQRQAKRAASNATKAAAAAA